MARRRGQGGSGKCPGDFSFRKLAGILKREEDGISERSRLAREEVVEEG